MQSIEITIQGRVQGVFFRYFTKKKADNLGIVGTVENLPKGDVKVIATGTRDMLKIFLEWCYIGSPASRVDNVKVEEFESLKDFNDFRILR